MNIISFPAGNSEEPNAAELAEIEQEWPLIAAELDLLDAEITCLTLGHLACALDRRRVRRAERRVLAVKRQLATGDEPTNVDGNEVA